MGLPQKINLDEELLKERFFDLNRAFHPDRAAKMKDERTRQIALRKSVLINNSFNTLRDRTRRIQYLIRQELGEREGHSGYVPIQLFELVEEVNELMGELRKANQRDSHGKNGDHRAELTRQLEAHLQELNAHRENFEKNLRAQEDEWDALCDRTLDFEQVSESSHVEKRRILQALSEKMDEISYVDSLIRRIKNTLYE